MKQWRLIIDVEKCENCNNCFLACKDEHCGNDWPGYAAPQPLHGHRWMNILRKERGQFPFVDAAYLPKPCYHCDAAPCMAAVPDGTIYRRPDGIVLIDPDKAAGRREIADVCPHGAIWWNAERSVAQKCTFCAHLLDAGWKAPRCAQACPTGALRAVHDEDAEMDRRIESLNLEMPESPRGPVSGRVHYRNLYRFHRAFIAGTAATGRDAVPECAAGAVLALSRNGEIIDRQTADAFGDFKFDGLPLRGGDYAIEIVHSGFPNRTLRVQLEDSLSLGTIWL